MAEDPKSKKSTPEKTAKVFDVAHPSKTTPSSTSKPVIVGHRNIIKNDPMVSPVETKKAISVSDDSTNETGADAAKPDSILDKPKRELKIEPPSEEKATVEDETVKVTEDSPEDSVASSEATPIETSDETTENPDDENTEDASVTETIEDSSQPEPIDEDQPADVSSEEGTLNAVVENVNTKKERLEEDDKKAKQAEEIQGLINSKKYNVKIHAPAKTRNLRWLLVLLVFILLAGAAWYFTLGPGKDLWIKTEPTPPKVSNAQSTPQSENQQIEEQPKNQVFEDKGLGLNFEYPSDWTSNIKEAEETSLELIPTGKYTVITLQSPEETIKTSDLGGVSGAEAKVYLQTKVYINNSPAAEQPSEPEATFTNCSTEDIVIAEKNLKLAFTETIQKEPNVNSLLISPTNCKPEAKDTYSLSTQFQLNLGKNSYSVVSKYIYTDDYMASIGITEKDVIETAKKDGVLVTKDSFKQSENYQKLQSVYKSLKEL